MSACRWWNESHTIKKTWTQFKSHFAAAHRQHKQMQGESAATAGYHSENAAVSHNEDQMAEATIGELANLATATCTSCQAAGGQLKRVAGTQGFNQEREH
jgi:hypothetical protein